MTNSYHTDIQEFNDIETLNYYHDKVGEISEKTVLKNINLGGRDNARRMIPWNGDKTKSWIAAYAYRDQVNVCKDMQSKKSVYRFYQKLIAIRKQYACFLYGDYHLIADGEYYQFERCFEEESCGVLINFETKKKTPPIDGEILLNNYESVEKILQPYQLIVYKK